MDGISDQCAMVTLKCVGCMSGVWPASSVACEEYGSPCSWGKVWWCLYWSEAALWFGLFSYRHNYNPFSYHKELWHGWIFEIGVHEG